MSHTSSWSPQNALRLTAALLFFSGCNVLFGVDESSLPPQDAAGSEVCRDATSVSDCRACCAQRSAQLYLAGARADDSASCLCDPAAGGGGSSNNASVCGNRLVEPGEDCDDGNVDDGDECSSLCLRPLSGSPAPGEGVDDCAIALSVPLNVGVEFVASQALDAATPAARGSCGGDGSELVFALTPAIAGRLELTLTPDPSLDAVLYVRRGVCADESAAAEAGCQGGGGLGAEARLSLPAELGTTYFLFVDQSAEPAVGAASFTLRARLDPPQPCEGEGTACQTGLPGACAAGTLRCSESSILICQPEQANVDEACGDGIDNDCNGDADENCPCGHDKCDEGVPLDATCTVNGVPDACIAAICASDPFCCDPAVSAAGRWDASCVTRVYSVCGALSCPAHAGTCTHGACEAGAALATTCDGDIGCVKKVCTEDPFCCGLTEDPNPFWDELCVAEVINLCTIKADVPVCPSSTLWNPTVYSSIQE
jgi:cysteine-rich repeat protein